MATEVRKPCRTIAHHDMIPWDYTWIMYGRPCTRIAQHDTARFLRLIHGMEVFSSLLLVLFGLSTVRFFENFFSSIEGWNFVII